MSLIRQFFKFVSSMIVLNGILLVRAQSGTSVISGSKHYYIETVKMQSFYQAAHACAKYDMKLASIENQNEYNRLFAVLQSTENIDKKYWLSGNANGVSNTLIWLGTGKQLSYLPPNQAALDPNTNKCLGTIAYTFLYETSSCTENKYYICERPLEPNCGKLGQCRYTYSYNNN